MARKILMMMWCVLILGLFKPTDSGLTVSTVSILVDYTTSLDVTCTFGPSGHTRIASLVSLMVFRTDNKDTNTPAFEELASVNRFHPEKAIVMNPVGANVSGRIIANGTSYLNMHWLYPSLEEGGIYRCRAIGLSESRRSVAEDDTKEVHASNPSMEQLVDKVRLQQMQLHKQDEILKDLKKFNNRLVTSLSRHYTRSSEYRGSYYLVSKGDQGNGTQDEAACRLLGGYLAEINDVNEHKFVKKFLSSSAPSAKEYVMVGAKLKQFPNTWVFIYSQQAVKYTEWTAGKPSNITGSCIYLVKDTKWKMANYACSTERDFVGHLCEVSIP